MKRQTLRLSVPASTKVGIKAQKTKSSAVATNATGGTITLKGTRNGN